MFKKLSNFMVFITLLKGFMTTGILFLPNGFYNGGWLFSIIVLIFSMIMHLICIGLLLEASDKVGGSLSDIGFEALGSSGKIICDMFISINQAGFSIAQIVFILQNSQTILRGILDITLPNWLIWIILLLIYSPLCWIRKIQRFSKYHIFSDLVVLATIIVVSIYALINLANNGISENIQPMNHNNYLLFFGTSFYIFEGVGIVIPIRDIWKSPKEYSKILTMTLFPVVLVFIGFGLLNYLSYGDQILQKAPLITKVLPDKNIFVQTLLVLFIIHLFILYPLTVHPAYPGLRQRFLRKWSKNFIRTIFILCTVIFAIYYEENIDRIISIIGSLWWIPIAFIFPALFHYILVADSIWEKFWDMLLMIFSLGLMVLTAI